MPRKLQDAFLDKVVSDRLPVMLFLINGVKLRGYLTAHDTYTVVLELGGAQQSVFKRAICTIVPAEPIDLREEAGAADGPAHQSLTKEPLSFQSSAGGA
jgi:host factor-I protein